ncbi:Rha family transcriptional regulator [Propionivibrio sp.]|uniref:Rha family transcriptional regulator n=1 Tax=Propionivibrio sp. TaxID=2212460 RepID=UPI003BF3C6E2
MNLIDLPADAVTLKADHPVTTSLRVAEIFGKQHKNVLQNIREIMAQVPENFNRLNFQPVEYLDEKGESRPAYELTRDGFTLLAMGFTGSAAMAFKLAFIERFNAMEQQLHSRATIGISIPPVLSLGAYLETRDSLHDLRAELDVLFTQLEQVDVRCKPAEIEAMTDPKLQVGKKVHLVRDLISTLEEHGVSRELAKELTGHNSNTVRQHAFQGKKQG